MLRPTLILAPVLALLAGPTVAAPRAAPLTLDQLLAELATNPDRTRPLQPMAPEWIGTIETTHTKDVENPEPPLNVRFGHGGIFLTRSLEPGARRKPYVIIARLQGGSYVATEGPHYRDKLPTRQELARMTSGDQLEELFGPQHGFTSGVGDGERWHWTQHWVWFTRTKPGELRYLSVFSGVSATENEEEELGPSRIDSLEIREGLFRPAHPDSAEEQEQYPSGETLFRLEEEARAKARQKYPRPLRDLLEVDEHPGDSDLVHYGTFLQAYRTNPEPKLLSQILAHAHEDTVRYGGFLEGIFTDRIASMVDELKDWQPARFNQAFGFLLEALPACENDDALFVGVKNALLALGGGELEFKDPDSDARLDLKVRPNGGYSYSHGVDHSPGIIRHVQQELRTRLAKRAEAEPKPAPAP